jgi:hypothetical protein
MGVTFSTQDVANSGHSVRAKTIPRCGSGLAKSHGSEILLHDRFLLYLGNGTNAIVNFDLLQLVGSHPGRIAAIGVLPHAVGSSGEQLNPALDEGANK